MRSIRWIFPWSADAYTWSTQAGISELVRKKTVLIIAHCMRTVANADKIVVLDNGNVAEMGTPAELKKQNGIFTRMVKCQIVEMVEALGLPQ